jgi:hypothetical protein
LRTDRLRINSSTRRLLKLEEQFRKVDQAGAREDLADLFQQIYSSINLHHIRTSREIDQFLQLSMIYIAARLYFDFRDSEATEFKLSTALYDSRHKLFVVKPSYFFPGRCAIRNTAILLARGEEEERSKETRPYESETGLSGLVLASGEVLHCTRLQGKNRCPIYAPLETPSSCALSIPLCVDLAGSLDRFRRAKIPASGPGPHCCDCRASVHGSPHRESEASSYGVLHIDCNTDELQIRKARKIIADDKIRAVLGLMVNRLAGYQADRAAYSVLRNCTALFELSQHTLDARQAYVALLREISAVCDGADVTLHLRDMFAKPDHDRGVRLIAGYGPRFRGFLVDERYGDGLVGEAMAGRGQFKSRNREEMASAYTGTHEYSYRLLMPGTDLNAVVPICFHTRVIGAVNIEWDKSQISGMTSEEEDRYLDARRPVLERLAQYFALVIDYFDDQENENLKPKDLTRQFHVRKSTSRRRVLAYYVDSSLQQIEAGVKEGKKREQLPWREYLEQILRDIIDAVGYFLTFEDKHRILASVRYRAHRSDGDHLDLVYAHGFDPKDGEELGPGGPIPVGAGQSVLGTCAELGVAVFGSVEDHLFLRPDRLCKECAPEEDQKILRRPIHYKPAGHRPVYEVGVPLVFGGDILGTFDFELFSLARNSPERGGAPEEDGDSPPALAGHELAAFLEWARAITFCMAYAEDALDSQVLKDFGDRQRSAFHRFQRLCAQIVANVKLPRELLTPIAAEYLRGLIPLGELELVPAKPESGAESASFGTASPSERVGGDPGEFPLWWRGEQLGTIRMSLATGVEPQPSVFPVTSLSTGTGILAQRFVAAFYAAALSAERGGELESDAKEFRSALEVVRSAFFEGVEALKRDAGKLPQLDPYTLIESLFGLLHQALQRLLPVGGGGSTLRPTSRHGWFLYIAECKEDPELDERAVLRSGEPFARWVAMNTQEMKTLVSRVLESQDPEKTLREILRTAGAEEILRDAPPAANHSVERLEDLFLEALARRGRDYPDKRRDQGPSLTAATIRQKRVRSDIDLNRSPVRSNRRSEWFFGDKSYSIIGVPILFANRVIGILQIFRRRDAIDDLHFFKNDEIKAVAKLGNLLEAAIAAEVECLPIPILRATAVKAGFTPEVIALGERVKDRIARQQVPLLVSCDFLAENASWHPFLDCYVGPEPGRSTYTTHDLLKLKTTALEQMDHPPVVCVLYSHTREKPSARLRERLAALTSASAVILFVSHGDEPITYDLLPSSSFERQETDDSAEVLRVAFGLAEGLDRQDGDEIGILLRRSGNWTIERLIEDCGTEAGVIRNSAKIKLKDLKARQHIGRRLFPDWYQNVEGAGLARRTTSKRRREVRTA